MRHYNYAQAVMSNLKVNEGASTSRQAETPAPRPPPPLINVATPPPDFSRPPPPYTPLHQYNQPPPQPPIGTPAPSTSRRPPPFDTPPPPISLPPRPVASPTNTRTGTFSFSQLFQNRRSIVVGPVTQDGLLERNPNATTTTNSVTPCNTKIKDVWAKNLHQEFHTIRKVVQRYSWVAMDSEFPGVVTRMGDSNDMTYQYHTLRMNVDLLRLIQLGITFMDGNGKVPPGICTWQFNFKFSLTGDTYAEQSIEHLRKSGLKFKRHEQEGIDHAEFAELLMTSGLILIEDITWLSFHSGFDFAYLYKLLTTQPLPLDEDEFVAILRLYFPNIYDVKHLMKKCKHLTGGLHDVANQLQIRRVGLYHQAGYDSQVIGQAFFKIKEIYFDHKVEHANGQIYGLRPIAVASGDDNAAPSFFGEPTFFINFPSPPPAIELYRRLE